MAYGILATLFASAIAATLVGRRVRNAVSQGRCPVPVNLGVPDDGERSNRKQASQVAIALLADAAELVLAPARVLLGHQSNPGCDVPSRPECPREVCTCSSISVAKVVSYTQRVGPPMCEAAHTASVVMCIMS